VSLRTTLPALAADLNYPRELQVHTAASGLVASLSARYLAIERSDGFRGAGEVRATLAICRTSRKRGRSRNSSSFAAACRGRRAMRIFSRHAGAEFFPSPCRDAAVENALIEGMARATLSVRSTSRTMVRLVSIQINCLFWGPDETFDRSRAFPQGGVPADQGAYCDRSFEHDLARLRRLRERAGPSVLNRRRCNGAWTAEEAIKRFACARADRFCLMSSNRRRPETGRLFARRLADCDPAQLAMKVLQMTRTSTNSVPLASALWRI